MPIQQMHIAITGVGPLLQNNPQTVDRFNPFTRQMAQINAKKTNRTDDDYLELWDIETRSRVHWADDIGVFVPGTWLISSLCAHSFRVCKVSKANVRGGVLATADKIPLEYRDKKKVKTLDDIVGNEDFRLKLTLKQGQSRIIKSTPIFHAWSFDTTLEFDDKIIDPGGLERTMKHAAKYEGFGDFRPTFGRAIAECSHV